MGLFRKRNAADDQPMSPEELMERSKVDGIRYRDLQVVGQLMNNGCNLEAPRHVIFYLYFPHQKAAGVAADALRKRGHQVEVREPWDKVPDWTVVAETHDRPLIPDFLRDTVDVCDELAQANGGTYDGWEAGPDLP